MIVIGIDPDAEKHGVAEYVDGELKSLATMSLPDLLEFITPRSASGVLFSIENVMAINSFTPVTARVALPRNQKLQCTLAAANRPRLS